ncbi:MAG TPA: hypothetical protein PKK48_00185 [Phycisphaerae bacterium]|nr:hypothetical protein [Phycisphaerae bacterium]HPS53460.1 hypothetical protein [Phycisphaerae bacterium]
MNLSISRSIFSVAINPAQSAGITVTTGFTGIRRTAEIVAGFVSAAFLAIAAETQKTKTNSENTCFLNILPLLYP